MFKRLSGLSYEAKINQFDTTLGIGLPAIKARKLSITTIPINSLTSNTEAPMCGNKVTLGRVLSALGIMGSFSYTSMRNAKENFLKSILS
jgi:hypothetical protein